MRFRLKYFLGHLAVSSVIAVLALLLIFGVWYPNPLDKALGVKSVLVVLLGIDVVLGPLMTLVLAKEGKKGLKFDLVVIAIMQLSALTYGIYSIDKGRPVWIAFDVNGFDVIQKHMIAQKEGDVIASGYDTFNWMGAKWVYTTPAKDDNELMERMKDDFEQGIAASARPALYQPIEKGMTNIISHSMPISALMNFNKSEEVNKILMDYPQADKYLPLRTSLVHMVVLIDSHHKKIVGIVDLRP